MTLRFTSTTERPHLIETDVVVVGAWEDRTLTRAAQEIDAASGGALARALASGDASGKIGVTTKLIGLAGVRSPRVLLVGLGEPAKFDAARFGRAASESAKALRSGPARRAATYLSEVDVPGEDEAGRIRLAALAGDAQAYRYTATVKPKNGAGIEALAIAGADASRALAEAEAIGAGVRLAKELGNLPPNICTPLYIAAQARELAAREANVSVEVLDRDAMRALGMGALLAVASGSLNEPQLVVLQYRGAALDEKPYVLVGKGITFDSGGISIKPGASMEEMKYDMMGGASVLGVMLATARLALPINLVVIVPAVENMPSGSAYRPSDILTSMSGLTIEVVNTDAEGRLILCDALSYAQRFEPRALVDVATLTGACVVALGKHAHGLFSRDDELAAELIGAGDRMQDRAWRMPLWDDYQQQIDSAFADMANVGGKYAGAITAACFLARYTERMRWAHLDIAGTAWDEGRKGMATGRPVPLLVQWLLDRVAAG
ncbi:MAG TPA: leucyl aminopeptidase [Candidatus Saccharimonadia bacterium]|nr:leucyl aminopeptidase [Candidatus Saccharimonadia bacterium]